MQNAASASAAPQSKGTPDPLSVMVVDDSAVIRGIFRRTLEADADIEVVAAVSNGQQAVDALSKYDIEVIVLDIEMPVMDGLTALPLLLEKQPGVKVIMASTLTEKNAAVSLQALNIGAADYIPKPSGKHEIHSADQFKRDLVEKVRALAGRRIGRSEALAERQTSIGQTGSKTGGSGTLSFRKPSAVAPKLLAIGSSTGGPQALFKVLEGLKGQLDHVPVVIAQHMPKAFTGILAEHLSKVSDSRCAEGVDGETLQAGRIYIAPGDFHMYLEKSGAGHVIRLNQDPPENYCRPSVEPLFRSVVQEFGPASLALMLTGMGHDGRTASETLVDAGGTLVAQDEETSVVWGMPGAVATAGLCAEVLPLDQIAGSISKYLRGATS